MVTVIHLSDLHIHRSDEKADNVNARVLVNYLCERFHDELKSKTYIVLTGDSVDDGAAAQYSQLRANVLSPLSEHFSLLMAPGNHDYAFGGFLFDDAAPKRFRDCVRPFVTSTKFPCITANREEKVLFIGLDSADPSEQQFIAEGIVTKEQRGQLARRLADQQYEGYFKVVYLHHHPFLRSIGMALRESEELLRVLSGNVDLVLFGHKHRSEAFFRRYRIPLMLASGKVTEPNGNALTFRVVCIEPGCETLVHTEEIPAADANEEVSPRRAQPARVRAQVSNPLDESFARHGALSPPAAGENAEGKSSGART
jgi:3',5'-cyclic AMP phosphodiesterase CpdA